MEMKSSFKRDVKLIETGFSRKTDPRRKICPSIRKCAKFKTLDILEQERELAQSFILDSYHVVPEITDGNQRVNANLTALHDVERKLINQDLKNCEDICTQRSFVRQFVSERNLNELIQAGWKSSDVIPTTKLGQVLTYECVIPCFSSKLQLRIQKINPTRRLSWLVNILINYHFGHECKEYMSLAIKLCLIAVASADGFRSFNFPIHYPVDQHLQVYFWTLQRNQCDETMWYSVMELFEMEEQINLDFFKNTRNFRYVVQNAEKADVELQEVFNSHTLGDLCWFDACLITNPINFTIFVECGGFSKYSNEEMEALKIVKGNYASNWRDSMAETCVSFDGGLIQLRTYQVALLYKLSKLMKAFAIEYILKLLWAAIPEPLLTKEDFKSCLKKTGQDRAKKEELMLVWQWYVNVLSDGTCPKKSPRSLTHLSKCAFRQLLATTYYIPKAIQFFKLPQKLISYILLEDCGENPFANLLADESNSQTLVWLYKPLTTVNEPTSDDDIFCWLSWEEIQPFLKSADELTP